MTSHKPPRAKVGHDLQDRLPDNRQVVHVIIGKRVYARENNVMQGIGWRIGYRVNTMQFIRGQSVVTETEDIRTVFLT